MIRKWTSALSLLSKFSILSFAILSTLAIILAWSLTWQLEKNALQVAADDASQQASYILGPILSANDLLKPLDPDIRAQLDTISRKYVLSHGHIVRIKIWNQNGVVIYSDVNELVGRKFPLSEELREAFAGKTATEISTLGREENVAERKEFSRLLEIYHPIRKTGSSQILGVYEIYHDVTLLAHEIDQTRYIIFTVIGLGFLLFYFSLFAIVRRASRELIRQNIDNERLYNEAKDHLDRLERADKEFQNNLQIQTAINTLLSVSLLDRNLDELLAELFEIIISLPWLKVEAKGCIFLVGEKSDVLIMVVQKRLDPSLVTTCAEVPFGRCLCGRAARTGEIEFADRVDERHENLYEGILPHGHYCVPIKFRDKVLGVLNLYLRAGHRRDKREEEVLKAITDVMAGIIERKRAEESIRENEGKFHSVVENATEGIYQTTADGHFLVINKAFVNMLGYASNKECMEAVTDIGNQIYVHPEKRRELLGIVDEHGFAKGFETEFYRKDGSRFWVSLNMQSIRDDKGRLLYYQGICEEITLKKRMEEERQQGVDRLRKALGGTVKAIASVVETRDPYTAGHQRRVADLARTIATEMGLESDRIEGLRVAGMIHDIGKISVPAEILSKPTKLTEIEFSLIKNHVQCGYDILKEIDFPWPIARMVLEHHEKMNGSGYPQGLSGDKLLIESRIITVADVVEAIASHRPYRPGLGIATALDEITKNRALLYDSAVVDVCLSLFNEKGYKMES